MKNLFILFFSFGVVITSYAQVGINANNTPPDPSAMLDVSSNDKGLLIPRMTTIQKNAIPNKVEGLVVYDTDLKQFSYWKDLGILSYWQDFGNTPSTTNVWTTNGNDINNSNSGNVGIGIINSTKAKLDIASANTTTALFGSTSTGISLQQNWPTIGFNQYRDDANVQRYMGNGYAMGNFMNPSTGSLFWHSIATGNAADPTPGETQLMSLDRYGVLRTNGLNSTSTTASLYIDGSFNVTPIAGGNADDGTLRIYSPMNALTSTFRYLSFDKESIQARRSSFISGKAEQNLKLNPFGGNVGIGTGGNSITSTLFVVKSTSSFDGTAVFKGTTHFTHFHYAGNEDTYIRGGKDGSAVILNDVPNGKVGIGRFPTVYQLEVNGTAKANEVIVETGWADYVFEQGYKLKSIDELEAFVKENKHLPNIPKASDIEKYGLKVGETNKVMMEKIEELALYIIQLKKEIDLLKTKN